MPTKICPVCHVEFNDRYSNHNIYCSRACEGLSRRTVPTKTCPTCGGAFYDPKHADKIYCSVACRHPPDKQVKLAVKRCINCGTEFTSGQSRQRFCGLECSWAFVRSKSPNYKVTLACEQCGAEFIDHRANRRKFCSPACFWLWRSENQLGVSNPNYRGGTKYRKRGANWKVQKKAALLRDGYKCCLCGRQPSKVDKAGIHVHHIRPYRMFEGDYLTANELRNLITLCRKCHNLVERHGYPCPQPLL